MTIHHTGYLNGPYAAIITDPKNPKGEIYPQIVMPEGGFKTGEEAMAWARTWAAEKDFALDITITNLQSPAAFKAFMSW